MRAIILILIFLEVQLIAQTNVSGIVVDDKSEVLIGANIFIKGTYDGTITDTDGKFSFNSNLTGEQTLVVSYLGFQDYEKTFIVSRGRVKNLKVVSFN